MGDDTKHSSIDPEGVLKRTVLRQGAHEHEIDHEIKPAIMRLEADVAGIRADLPIIKEMLVVALKPTQIPPTWNRAVLLAAASVGVIAGCALIFTVAFLAKIVIIPPAFASVPPKIEQHR
jgi:hypothetical protein